MCLRRVRRWDVVRALSRFLSPGHLKTEIVAAIKARLHLSQNRDVCKEMVRLWAIEAKALWLAFRSTFNEDNYEQLHVVLQEEMSALLRVSCYIAHMLQN